MPHHFGVSIQSGMALLEPVLNDVQKRIDEIKQKEAVPSTATNESTAQQTSESESSSN